jgi:hypothetical protein
MIEPVHPAQGRELHILQTTPGSSAVDQFALVQAVDGLGQGVVVGVANATADTPPTKIHASSSPRNRVDDSARR